MELGFLRSLTTPVDDGFVSLFTTVLLFLLMLTLVVYQHSGSLRGLTLGPHKHLPPGNDGLPFLGETHLLASQKADFFRRRRIQFGAVFRTHLFGCPAVRVTGENHIKQLMNTEERQVKSYYPLSVRRLLGDSFIVAASGLEHRRRKRHFTKYLSHEFFLQRAQDFSGVVTNHLQRWARQEVVDIYPACKAISAEVALKFLLEMNPSSVQVNKIRSLMMEFTDNLFGFPLYFPGTSYYKAHNAKSEIIKVLRELNRAQTDESSLQSKLQPVVNPTEDDETNFNILFEMLFVGADNNGSGMFAIINLLAHNPQVVAKARHELGESGLLHDSDLESRKITLTEINSLPYIKAIVKESLRLMPPVGGLYRTVKESFTINDFFIPRGWRVLAGIRETHENDPQIRDPLVFNPDRWIQGGPVPAFLTFGGGLRVCPGKQYADILLRVFVIELIRHWKVDIVKDSEITMFPSVRPRTEMLMALQEYTCSSTN